MKFLVDNSLSPRLCAMLAEQGHDAVHVREFGLASADDEVIFDLGSREDPIIDAQDTDFGTILALRSVAKPSVLLLRARTRSVDGISRLIAVNLPSVAADLQQGSIVTVEDARVRVRALPIRGETRS